MISRRQADMMLWALGVGRQVEWPVRTFCSTKGTDDDLRWEALAGQGLATKGSGSVFVGGAEYNIYRVTEAGEKALSAALAAWEQGVEPGPEPELVRPEKKKAGAGTGPLFG